MEQGWEVSFVLSVLLPLGYLIFSQIGDAKSRLTFFEQLGESLGLSILFFLLLSPFIIFILFSGIHSIVNLAFIMLDGGYEAFYLDFQQGNASLRVASIVMCWTAFDYFLKKTTRRIDIENRQAIEQENTPGDEFSIQLNKTIEEQEKDIELVAEKTAKSTGRWGNLFFGTVIFLLWFNGFNGGSGQAYAYIAWLLFFIIDDWSILIHFKLEAAQTVTWLHNCRLYSAIVCIAVLSIWGCVEANANPYTIVTGFVVIFACVTLRYLHKESLAVKTLKKDKKEK